MSMISFTFLRVIVLSQIFGFFGSSTIVEGLKVKAVIELNVKTIIGMLKRDLICHQIESAEEKKNKLNHLKCEKLLLLSMSVDGCV